MAQQEASLGNLVNEFCEQFVNAAWSKGQGLSFSQFQPLNFQHVIKPFNLPNVPKYDPSTDRPFQTCQHEEVFLRILT